MSNNSIRYGLNLSRGLSLEGTINDDRTLFNLGMFAICEVLDPDVMAIPDEYDERLNLTGHLSAVAAGQENFDKRRKLSSTAVQAQVELKELYRVKANISRYAIPETHSNQLMIEGACHVRIPDTSLYTKYSRLLPTQYFSEKSSGYPDLFSVTLDKQGKTAIFQLSIGPNYSEL